MLWQLVCFNGRDGDALVKSQRITSNNLPTNPTMRAFWRERSLCALETLRARLPATRTTGDAA